MAALGHHSEGPQLSQFFQKSSLSPHHVFPSDTDSSFGASPVAQRTFYFHLVAHAPVILFVAANGPEILVDAAYSNAAT